MKRRLLTITVSLLATSSTLLAQTTPTLNWAESLGSASEESGVTLITDSNGDIIVSGTFNGTLDFDPGPGTAVRTATAYSAYIAKYTSDGELMWVNEFLSTHSVHLGDLEIDASDNVYAAGVFYQDIDLLPGTGTNLITTLNYQAIMMKMTSNGSIVFTYTTETTTGQSAVNNLAVNAFNEVYMTNFQYGVADYDNGPGSQIIDNQVSGSLYYLVKLNQDGTLNWVKDLEPEVYDMAIDSTGKLVLTGLFYNATIDIAPGTPVFNITKTNPGDNFIFSVDGNGIYQNHFVMENSSYMYVNNLCIDHTTQDILFSGTFMGNSNFEPATMDHVVSTTTGAEELFVARFTNNGVCKWAFGSQGDPSSSYLQDNDIKTDILGNVLVCGAVNGTYDVNPGSATNVVTNTNAANFIFKWDSSGNFKWAYELIESGELEELAISNDGNYVYMTGYHNLISDVDPEGTTTIPVVGGNDFFLIKWNNCDMDITIFNNGSALAANETSAGTTYQWFDGTGNPIPGATSSTFKPTENGDYQVLISKGDCSYFSSSYSVTNAGLESTVLEGVIAVYPNPAENYLVISGVSETSTVQVVDLLGNSVYQTQIYADHSQINVEQLAAGSYILLVTQGDATSSVIFLKN